MCELFFYFYVLIMLNVFYFFFFKQKTAYEISACLVGSEMCIRDSRGDEEREQHDGADAARDDRIPAGEQPGRAQPEHDGEVDRGVIDVPDGVELQRRHACVQAHEALHQ